MLLKKNNQTKKKTKPKTQKQKCKNPRTHETKQTRICSTLSQSPLLFCFFSSSHDTSTSSAWIQGTLLFILTCNHFAQGDVIFKIWMGAGDPIYCHHIIKLPTNIQYLLRFAHICVLIIDSQLYLEQNATQISQYFRADGMKSWLSFDRLSHLIVTLKHRGEKMGGRNTPPLLNLKRCFWAKHFQSTLSWKCDFFFSC